MAAEMNIIEGLMRQVRRVAYLRERYQGLHGRQGANVGPALMVMDSALERACKAAGAGDPVAIIAIGQELESFTE